MSVFRLHRHTHTYTYTLTHTHTHTHRLTLRHTHIHTYTLSLLTELDAYLVTRGTCTIVTDRNLVVWSVGM